MIFHHFMTPGEAMIVAVLIGVTVGALLRGGSRRHMKGRYISRPAIRLLGYARAHILRVALGWVWVVAPGWIVIASLAAAAAWAIDDLRTGDDEDRESRLAANLRKWLGALRPLGYSTSTAPNPT